MSKKNNLFVVIDKMITNAEGMLNAVRNLSDSVHGLLQATLELKEVLTEEPKAVKVIAETKQEEKKYTKENVRGMLASKSAAGYRDEVRTLLLKYGADKFSTLSPNNYAAVMKEAEVIGND